MPPWRLSMPNQRDPNKKKLQTWMFEKDINVLKEVAKKEGLSLSELLTQLTNELKKQNNKK
jgi:uncharacterized protein YidB (DUF937 family)|tara:strand:+ start:171 stop:353 length:183 start_codon:yes stop_codon:yes gene_type:complete